MTTDYPNWCVLLANYELAMNCWRYATTGETIGQLTGGGV